MDNKLLQKVIRCLLDGEYIRGESVYVVSEKSTMELLETFNVRFPADIEKNILQLVHSNPEIFEMYGIVATEYNIFYRDIIVDYSMVSKYDPYDFDLKKYYEQERLKNKNNTL